jgi:hypothetical protein
MFGLALEADIEEKTHDAKDRKSAMAKAKMVLDRWLREPDDTPRSEVAKAQQEARAAGKSGFCDPAEMLRKKE